MEHFYGGIEAGGTKFVCAVGSGPETIQSRARFMTTSPEETIGSVIDFFKQEMSKVPIRGIGIGSFGPLDLDSKSPTYGSITSPPKPGWSKTNILSLVQNALNVPAVIDTDVNTAALGEQKWGAGRGLDNFIYLTVGTGIGGGGILQGNVIHGLIHPEMGHMHVPHDLHQDPFPGSCPFHGDCLEGLASGAAMGARWGKPSAELPPDHPAWELESTYLAWGLANLACILSPRRIILGGGVMNHAELFPQIRRKVHAILNGYLDAPEFREKIEKYITPPELGNSSGVLGAIALAQSSIPEPE